MTLQICNNGCLVRACSGIAICDGAMLLAAADVINSARYVAKDRIDALPLQCAADGCR
jgi:hypothetical protein